VNQNEKALSLDSFLPYRAARFASALSRALANRYQAQHDISLAEWRVMMHLMQVSEISIRDIFLRVDLDRARVTRAVQRLEARGLVSKLVNEDDRRLIRLALTDAGWDMARDLTRLAKEFEADLFRSLSPDLPVDAAAGQPATPRRQPGHQITAQLLMSFDALESALAQNKEPRC